VTKRRRSRSRATSRRRATSARRSTRETVVEPEDFATEYRYVLGDLKQIAILAAAMFATLIVLALVLQ
jgi:hypothetical protein